MNPSHLCPIPHFLFSSCNDRRCPMRVHVHAGPGTIAEAMICGLPMHLLDLIAGQVRP
jgi:hypothetical protein